MNRQKLLIAAMVPALAVMGLSACNRASDKAGAEGFVTTDASTTQQSDTLPAQPQAAPATYPQAEGASTTRYAEVTKVVPVTVSEKVRGTVTNVQELVEDSTAPREVCADVAVEERQPERDGNAGGTIAGAVVGGALGNQVGKGDGRKLATIAGAIAGGFAGREVDRRHEGGKVVTRTEQQCHTENKTVSDVTGYEVTFRRPDGSTSTRHMDSRPAIGSSIDLGSSKQTIGYDVTYRYDGEQSTVRMDRRPGDQLPVVDGRVVLDSRPLSNG